jgi:hypothetical protein
MKARTSRPADAIRRRLRELQGLQLQQLQTNTSRIPNG